MAIPKFVQTTSTDKPLRKGPADMPDRGGKAPNAQISSSTVNLSRKENFVAAFGAKPGMGEVQCESTKVKLSRTANSPYQREGMSATKPQIGFKGKKGK
jgi:hypothetical protein